jgi:hypothetical protein
MKRACLFMLSLLMAVVLIDPSRLICCEGVLGLRAEDPASAVSEALPCHGRMATSKSSPEQGKATPDCHVGIACAKCAPLTGILPISASPHRVGDTAHAYLASSRIFVAYVVELPTPPPRA